MLTDEKIKELLENSPDKQELINKELEYFFPKWLESKYKERIVKQLPKRDIEFLYHCLLLSSITETELESSCINSSHRTKELIANVLEGNDNVLDELHEIFIHNVENVKKEYKIKIRNFLINSLPKKKRQQMTELLSNGMEQKVDEILDKQQNNENVIQLKEGYDLFCVYTSEFDIHQFTCSALKSNQGLVRKAIFAIDNPAFLMPIYVDNLINGKHNLTSEWYLYRKLTVPQYKELLNSSSSQQQWDYLYNLAIKSILSKMEVPILPIIKRKSLIKSILSNFENQYYASALIIIFSVIEGLLWELSWQISMKERVFERDKKSMFDCEKKEVFQSTRIRDVIERTSVRNYLDKDFIREFCDELYEERNPILHGNMVCHYEYNNFGVCFIKKLFVLDYLLNINENVFQKQLFDYWDESFSYDKIEEFIKMLYR